MPKINTISLLIDGETIQVDFKCSKQGIFSYSIPYWVANKLNIEKELSGKTLSELEDTVNKAYIQYINAKKTVRLVVAIQFKASKEFTKDSEGNIIPGFLTPGNPNIISNGWCYELYSLIGFGYKIFAEVSLNDRATLYDIVKKNMIYNVDDTRVIGDFYYTSQVTPCKDWKILPYSEDLINNLKSIEQQLRNASSFLINLFTNENLNEIITSNNFKQLIQKL